MPVKKKKKKENEIFNSIRKPVAPPTKQIGTSKPEEKMHPSGRKLKHRKPVDLDE